MKILQTLLIIYCITPTQLWTSALHYNQTLSIGFWSKFWLCSQIADSAQLSVDLAQSNDPELSRTFSILAVNSVPACISSLPSS